jgi:hypothetical protein
MPGRAQTHPDFTRPSQEARFLYNASREEAIITGIPIRHLLEAETATQLTRIANALETLVAEASQHIDSSPYEGN